MKLERFIIVPALAALLTLGGCASEEQDVTDAAADAADQAASDAAETAEAAEAAAAKAEQAAAEAEAAAAAAEQAEDAADDAADAEATEDDYASVTDSFRQSPAVAPFFDSAYGYAIFPTIGKGGFVVGGAYGKGRVYANGVQTGTASVTQASIGLQAGGQAFSQIIFFEDQAAYDNFTGGNFEFDAKAEAVAITAGASAQAGTTGDTAGASAGGVDGAGDQAQTMYKNGMATFTFAKGGLMAGAAIGGQKFKFDSL